MIRELIVSMRELSRILHRALEEAVRSNEKEVQRIVQQQSRWTDGHNYLHCCSGSNKVSLDSKDPLTLPVDIVGCH